MKGESSCQRGLDEFSGSLEKELFLWHEVLVPIDCCLLPEGNVSKGLCPVWEGLATILLADLRVFLG